MIIKVIKEEEYADINKKVMTEISNVIEGIIRQLQASEDTAINKHS